MRHPCLILKGKRFVANDIKMGVNEHEKIRMMLLTGSNMGGKSTYCRMVCLAVIIAQLGCYVPAKSCRFSLVDRVFTRIGASD